MRNLFFPFYLGCLISTLEVIGGATLTISPANLIVAAGKTASFSATSNGAAVAVTWSVSNLPTTSVNGITVLPNQISPAMGTSTTATMTAGSVPGNFVVTATTSKGVVARAYVTVNATASLAPNWNLIWGGIFNQLTWPSTQPTVNAGWLYTGVTGNVALTNISSSVSSYTFSVNTHDGGWDYPVQFTYSTSDTSHHQTCFSDNWHWSYSDIYCVPDPPGGYAPSTQSDGHLVVVDYVDAAAPQYWDFWSFTTNSAGKAVSSGSTSCGTTNGVANICVGQIKHGWYDTGSGNPGTTAALISGLSGGIMPGELNCATCLNHALNVIVPAIQNTSQLGDQGPATHTDGSAAKGVFREGAKIFLDPNYSIPTNTATASIAVQAIMHALQKYGGVITDQTGCNNCIATYSSLATAQNMTGQNLIIQHLWIAY